MTSSTNKPATEIRDGAIKATIWKNSSEKGHFFSVEFSRTFKDETGAFRTATSFSGTQLLVVSRLAEQAYDEIAALRASQKAQDAQEAA